MAIQGKGEDAQKIKEQNTYDHFYWMENAKGRRVPVAVVHVKDALKNGYMHLDRKIVIENHKDHVKAPVPKSESERMAEAMEVVADAVAGKKKDSRTPEEKEKAKARMAKARAARKKKVESEVEPTE